MRWTLLLAAAAALLLPPAAHAGYTTKTFKVEITGIHVVDWTYQSGPDRDVCKDWSAGSGTQTIGFTSKRPITYTVTQVTGKRPKGVPAVMMVAEGLHPLKVTAARKVNAWDDHLAPGRCSPCEQEGGCSGPVPGRPAPPKPATDCAARTRTGQATLEYLADAPKSDDPLLANLGNVFVGGLSTGLGDTYKRCYPDVGAPVKLHFAEPDEIRLSRASRAFKLPVGGKRTFKADSSRSWFAWDGESDWEVGCSEPPAGPGYRECAITDITVEIRRTR